MWRSTFSPEQIIKNLRGAEIFLSPSKRLNHVDYMCQEPDVSERRDVNLDY